MKCYPPLPWRTRLRLFLTAQADTVACRLSKNHWRAALVLYKVCGLAKTSRTPARLRLVMAAEHWWCHERNLPGGRWLCNRFDAWVMRDATKPRRRKVRAS